MNDLSTVKVGDWVWVKIPKSGMPSIPPLHPITITDFTWEKQQVIFIIAYRNYLGTKEGWHHKQDVKKT